MHGWHITLCLSDSTCVTFWANIYIHLYKYVVFFFAESIFTGLSWTEAFIYFQFNCVCLSARDFQSFDGTESLNATRVNRCFFVLFLQKQLCLFITDCQRWTNYNRCMFYLLHQIKGFPSRKHSVLSSADVFFLSERWKLLIYLQTL